MVRAHDFRLANREVASEADVEALVAEIRDQLLVQIRPGAGVGSSENGRKPFVFNDVRDS